MKIMKEMLQKMVEALFSLRALVFGYIAFRNRQAAKILYLAEDEITNDCALTRLDWCFAGQVFLIAACVIGAIKPL
jgi:hypothetical protein